MFQVTLGQLALMNELINVVNVGTFSDIDISSGSCSVLYYIAQYTVVSDTIGFAQLRWVKELSYTKFDKHATFFHNPLHNF